MIKVGITGGIGSGKSVVCNIFQTLGIEVYSADNEAKKMLDDSQMKEKILEIFGSQILKSGLVDRKKLAEIVFKDKLALQKLNSIIHPAVKKHFDDWAKMPHDSPYVLKEAAILFESGTNKGLDFVITVTAPEELRLKRVISRDKISEAEVLKRMENQMTEKEKIKLSDFVIKNDEQDLLIPQVLEIHNKILGKN